MENKFKLAGTYNYLNKLDIWRKYAERNKEPQNCGKCQKPHIHKTVLLETNEHICWYCWIKKDASYAKVIVKPPHTVKKLEKNSELKKSQKINSKTYAKNNSIKNSIKTINEGDVLENVLGEVDLMDSDTSHINEITKLANSVFIDDMIEPEIIDIMEDSQLTNSAQPVIKKSTKSKSSINKTSIKAINNKPAPAIKKSVKIEKTKSKPAIEKTVNKEINISNPNDAILNVQQPVDIKPQNVETTNEINYSKYNPVIKKFNLEKSKKMKIFWTIGKYSILLITLAFAILALYYSTIWQSVNNNGFLVNAGLIKNNIFNFSNVIINGVEINLTSALTDKSIINALNILAPGLATMGISELTNFSNEMLYAMIVFSVFGLVSSISVFFFKNGTIWSLSLMLFSLVFVTITITLWSLGIVAESTFTTPFNNINSLFKDWSSNTINNNNIEIDINKELQNLINLISK